MVDLAAWMEKNWEMATPKAAARNTCKASAKKPPTKEILFLTEEMGVDMAAHSKQLQFTYFVWKRG